MLSYVGVSTLSILKTELLIVSVHLNQETIVGISVREIYV